MLYFSYNCIEASVRAYGRCPMCNEPTSADSLIPNVTCKGTKLLQIYISLTLVFSLVGEVIYKYKKQREAENRQDSLEVLVLTLLYTHHPVMTEAWMGYMLLNRMSP